MGVSAKFGRINKRRPQHKINCCNVQRALIIAWMRIRSTIEGTPLIVQRFRSIRLAKNNGDEAIVASVVGEAGRGCLGEGVLRKRES